MAASKKTSSKTSPAQGKGASSSKSLAKAAAKAAVVKKVSVAPKSPAVAPKAASGSHTPKPVVTLPKVAKSMSSKADLWLNLKATVRENPAMAVVMAVAVLLALMLMFD